jgi:glycosyltransferase involved in cell wall biosynthesis
LPSIRHGCYRNSRIATLPLAISVELHRRIGTWTENVDAFISLSDFQRDRMASAGLPATRTYVKPNFCPDPPEVIEWRRREDQVVYVGRLSPEKGVESLVRAWLQWGQNAPRLKLIGDGPLSQMLRRMAGDQPYARIEFTGQVVPAIAKAEIARARMLVVPSEGFEGFPMVVADALASGTPVAASRIGPLPELVGDGISGTLFEAGDPSSILNEVMRVWHTPGKLERLSKGARSAYERSYTTLTNYRTLMTIYQDAIKHRRGRRVPIELRN